MSDYGISAAHAVTIAGSTFAFGFIFGWIWAVLHFGGSSNHSNNSGKDD